MESAYYWLKKERKWKRESLSLSIRVDLILIFKIVANILTTLETNKIFLIWVASKLRYSYFTRAFKKLQQQWN